MPYYLEAPEWIPDGTVEHAYKESCEVKNRILVCQYPETKVYLEKYGYREKLKLKHPINKSKKKK